MLCLLTPLCALAFSSCALFPTGPEIVHANRYHFQPQTHWTAISKGDSDSAYRTKDGSVFSLTSSCNGHPDAPLEVLTRHLLIGSRKVHYVEQRRLKLDGADALFSNVENSYQDEPFHLLIVVTAKNDCIFDFTMLNPKSISSQDENEFWAAIRTFSYGKN
jgi:hypothetical protein